jgi:hypothetical protein
MANLSASFAAATDNLPPDLLSSLLNSGALERHTASRAALVADDDGARFMDLVWYSDRNAYGYFDAADGHVVLTPDAQTVFRLNLPWWFRRLVAHLALCNATQPTEIVPNHAWDIGDLWITRQRKIPVLFARRLNRDAQFAALQAALAKRRGRCGGLIITEPIYLSPDGRRLVINGDTTIDFKSKVHIAIIRQLVAGYYAGKRFRATELLEDAGSRVITLRRAFGAKKWALLESYLKSENGLWAFDI